MVHLAILLALAQSLTAADVSALERGPQGELLLPDSHLVTRLLNVGDVDGDGADDLALSRAVLRECAFERGHCGVDLVSGGRVPLGAPAPERGLVALDALRAGAGGEGWQLRVFFEAWDDAPRVELRSLDGGRLHWTLRKTPIPLLDDDGSARLLPAPDGAGVPDVVLAVTLYGIEQHVRGPQDFAGVAKLSGRDGSTLWVHRAPASAYSYGRHVESAGDVDGDGVTDVVVCVPELAPTHADPALRPPHLEYLSGADGSVLTTRALPPERVHSFRAAGDLDGDGRPDFVLRTSEQAHGEGEPLRLVLSSAAEPVRVLADHEVLWCAPWTAAGAHAELLVGVRDRSSDAQALMRVSSQAAERWSDYPADLARTTQEVVCGDFDGDGRRDLAVLDRLPRRRMGYVHRLRVLPDASPR
jgi:hypothetical protein